MLVEQDPKQCVCGDPCICIGRCQESEDWGIWQGEINEIGQIVALTTILQMGHEREIVILSKMIADTLQEPVYQILPNNDLELIQSPVLDQ